MNNYQLVLLAWLLIACIVGFITAVHDKRAAKRHAWRVPEKSFVLLSIFGGGAGVLGAFYAVRHKTRHTGLLVACWCATVLSCAAYTYIFILLQAL